MELTSKLFDNPHQLVYTKILIYFRDFPGKLFFVTLGEASHNKKVFQATFFFGLDKLKNCIDGFLLGIENKSAGVDDCSIENIFFGGIEDQLEMARIKLFHENFGIHKVLGTSK